MQTIHSAKLEVNISRRFCTYVFQWGMCWVDLYLWINRSEGSDKSSRLLQGITVHTISI